MARSLAEKMARHAERETSPTSQDTVKQQPLQKDVLTELPLGQVETDPDQPRKDLGNLDELKASIAKNGLVQPIIVKIVGEDRYRVIAGERRFTACQQLGLSKIAAIVRSIEEQQKLTMQIIENLHRKDLTPFEEAKGYQLLMKESGMTQAQIGEEVGKSQVVISEILKLLELPENIQQEYRTSDKLSRSILLEISRETSAAAQSALWEQAKRGELTVKQVRQQKRNGKVGSKTGEGGTTAMTFFRYPIQTQMGTVTIAFEQSKPSQEDIVSTLREALQTEEARLLASNT